MRTAHLSIEQKIGVNLDGILFDTEIVLQLSLVTIELLVEGLRLPEVIVQHLEGVQDVGHFGDQLSLGGITFFLHVGFFSPLKYLTYCLKVEGRKGKERSVQPKKFNYRDS